MQTESENKRLTIRPYARLLTMLGDQLIKNEVIALTELIKNSYDADAEYVKVSLVNFGSNYEVFSDSKIIIEDNGVGMTKEDILNKWMNPATTSKFQEDIKNKKTQKGRIIQGEKGIGRFSIFKLGRYMKITTKTLDDSNDFELIYDFRDFDDNFTKYKGVKQEIFLDDLDDFIKFKETSVNSFMDTIYLGITETPKKNQGLRIEICGLKTKWTYSKYKKLQNEINMLMPTVHSSSDVFDVYYYLNENENRLVPKSDNYLQQLANTQAVFRITEGVFDAHDKKYIFNLNDRKYEIGFDDPKLYGLSEYGSFLDRIKRDSFKYDENDRVSKLTRLPGDFFNFGSFKFSFFVFDLNVKSGRYGLSPNDKKVVKSNRVYLYRDNIRVLPYGSVDDDWLNIDIDRGTIRAGEFIGNDQVVGFVNITQEDNPYLKDKTNREGIIEIDDVFTNFTNSIRLFLKYIRVKHYQEYLIRKAKSKETEDLEKGKPLEIINDAKNKFKDDKKVVIVLNKIEQSYSRDISIYKSRINVAEDLAAIGLSIESSTHDILSSIDKVDTRLLETIKDLKKTDSYDRGLLIDKLKDIQLFSKLAKSLMRNIQVMFPSTKGSAKDIDIKVAIERVKKFYDTVFFENDIEFEIRYINYGQPLIINITDAVIFQFTINLLDNAVYWLKRVSADRKIVISIDSVARKVIFSDSGPGISDDIRGYIFREFYSTKGIEGRGLGLYISKQLLDRFDASIRLDRYENEKVLNGANFVIEFKEAQV